MADSSSIQHLWASPAGRLLLAAMALAALSEARGAEDVVYVTTTSDRGYMKLTGRVVDYTGRELRLQASNGSEQRFLGERVLRIETEHGPAQVEADRRFARREFGPALDLYRQARDAETRPWVRRQIIAQIVWCYRNLARPEMAGEEFLLLVRSDPTTPHFGCIPLAWIPSQPSLLLERSAQQWLARDDMPAAVLLGASHLLPTRARPRALEKLRKLTTDADRRIAFLALAQTWRAAAVTAGRQQLAGWSETIERMPEPLRAGPYYVLGLAWAQQKGWEQAALAWLRVPILYPEERPLAARSLLEAGQSLERLGRTGRAVRLYSELIETFPETQSAVDAQARLREAAANEET